MMLKRNARKVSDWYDCADHDPCSDSVVRAYAALATETIGQYETILATGFRFEFTDCDPYANSNELFNDYDCGGFRVFLTDRADMPVDHPMGAESGYDGLILNDVFRAVHDYYGHCQCRYSFGPNGEDNAYRYHRQMYSQSARPALAAETRGQNSWFNFGPHSAQPVQSRPFAQQKALAAPAWVVDAE